MADAPTTGHRSRYQQVAGVLARHGLGALSDALGR